MHVNRVSAVNFRVFGARDTNHHLDLTLSPGLNVLVGENDAGKTSIVDVLRYVLLTSSNDYIRIDDDDFHIQGVVQAEDLELEVELRGLSEPQQAALLDWLTFEEGVEPYLVVHLHAKRRLNALSSGRLTQPIVRVNAGKGGDGPELGGAAPPRHNSCRLLRTKNLGAVMKDRSGTIRTIIQRPGSSSAVAA